MEEEQEHPAMPPKIPHPGPQASPEELTDWRRQNLTRAQEIRRLRGSGDLPPKGPQPPPKKRGRPPGSRKSPEGGTGDSAVSSVKLRVHGSPPPPVPTGPEIVAEAVDADKLKAALMGLGASANLLIARGTDIWLMEDDEASLMAESLATMAAKSDITRKAINVMPAIYLCLGMGAYFVKNVPDTMDLMRSRRRKHAEVVPPPPPAPAPGLEGLNGY